jgi:hypothetical protein
MYKFFIYFIFFFMYSIIFFFPFGCPEVGGCSSPGACWAYPRAGLVWKEEENVRLLKNMEIISWNVEEYGNNELSSRKYASLYMNIGKKKKNLTVE